MNCRDFLNEFEDRNALSETATLHISDCEGCRKINVIQSHVWQLIDRFEPVDVPNDFNFRIKARIANAKPSDFQPHFFPLLRYVLGMSAVGLILAFVVFNGVYWLDDKTVPAIAEHNLTAPIQREDPSTNSSPFEQVAVADVLQSSEDKKLIVEISKQRTERAENKKQSRTSKNETLLIAVKSTKKPQIKNTKDDEKNFTGSQTQSVKPPRIIMPKGIPNSTRTNEKPSNFQNVNPITAEQILSQLGIEIASENGRREVKKIKQNSVAELSGIKVGDLVEAIDGEKLTNEPIRTKTIEGKKLTILRGTEKIEITLRN
jgi:hypothetical protein